MVDEGAAVFRAIMRMDRQAGALIHQQDMVILIHNVQLGGCHRQEGIILPGFLEKLIVDIQLQHITGFQPGIPLRSSAIELDPLDADVLLGQRSRQQRNCLGKEAVQPLPGIIFSNGKLFHLLILYSSQIGGSAAP